MAKHIEIKIKEGESRLRTTRYDEPTYEFQITAEGVCIFQNVKPNASGLITIAGTREIEAFYPHANMASLVRKDGTAAEATP